MLTRTTRRHALALLGAGGVMLTTPLAFAQQAGDVAFVKRLATQLIAIINAPGSLTDKRQQILPLVDRDVDVNGIARFCLGRYWRVATPEQQQHFLDLFHRVLVNSITDKLGSFEGVRVEVGSSEPRGPGRYAVSTAITRPGQPQTMVQWVVSDVGGSPKISDVIGEGVSLSITQRGDYTSYLEHNGNDVDALLKAMERQAARQA